MWFKTYSISPDHWVILWHVIVIKANELFKREMRFFYSCRFVCILCVHKRYAVIIAVVFDMGNVVFLSVCAFANISVATKNKHHIFTYISLVS